MSPKSLARFALFCALLLCATPFSFAQETAPAIPDFKVSHLRSLPMARWLREGAISVVSSPHDIGEVENLFDGDLSTVLRSANVNPQQTTVQWDEAVSLAAVRVATSDPKSRWKIEGFVWEDAVLPTKREIVPWTNVEVGAAHQIVFPRNLSVTELTLTVERLGDDAHVHLHEWELFTQVPADAIEAQ